MERQYIHEEALSGDAPGAVPVTIIVDGRELVIPRMYLLFILNKAHLHASGELAKYDDAEQFFGAPSEKSRAALREGREWQENICDITNKLSDFVRSR